ncbi:hypothetical protein NLG97_g4557 [Lecanicillium saksenae]|uniref:Uncharacterized protein n=1 Tax=Lecanicillium saksenae TaxID=468837 RepID=A0ACC1QY91_9HYPO|nr:hypothetical protein NLG97_g4557 [Lecanicillium saksenae]
MSLPFVTKGYEAEVVDCRAMRRALGLPEILRSIFEYLPKEHLVAAMRANHFWFEMATDVFWRDVHVHYLNYVPWNRQQYYANKITTVSLKHVQARNAYVSSQWLKFPRIQKAYFEGDETRSARDSKFLYPFLTDCLTSVNAFNFDIGSAFFDMLNRAASIREVGFSISPGKRFPDYDWPTPNTADEIEPEPNLNDLVAPQCDPERIASARSVFTLIANRPNITRLFLAHGTDHLVTRQLLLAIGRLRDMDSFYLSRPLSDVMAAELARMGPPPFQSLGAATFNMHSYSLPRISPLLSNVKVLRLSIRDAESSRLFQSLGTLTKLESLGISVPMTTKTTGDDLTWLAPLTQMKGFTFTFNDIEIPWLVPNTTPGFGDSHLRIMVARWSQLQELSVPLGTEFTEKAFFALGHSCPQLKTVYIPYVREFSPLVFEPLGEPLFPCLEKIRIHHLIPLPDPAPAPSPAPPQDLEDYDEWLDRPETPRPDTTISKFMPTLRKHFPALRGLKCPDPGGKFNFLYRSWLAVATRDEDPDNLIPRRHDYGMRAWRDRVMW